MVAEKRDFFLFLFLSVTTKGPLLSVNGGPQLTYFKYIDYKTRVFPNWTQLLTCVHCSIYVYGILEASHLF